MKTTVAIIVPNMQQAAKNDPEGFAHGMAIVIVGTGILLALVIVGLIIRKFFK